jgi:hypothetical protein
LWSSSFSIYENIHKDQSLKKDLVATATRFGLLYLLFDVGTETLYGNTLFCLGLAMQELCQGESQ